MPRSNDNTYAGHRQEVDVGSVLKDSCEAGTTCRVMFVHSGQSMPAVLESVEGSRVQVRIACDALENGIVPRSLVCLSFPHRASLYAFFACILDVYSTEGSRTSLFVERPSRLTVVNLRRSFRVPVVFQSGLQADACVCGRQSVSVNALNVAETGIEFEFAPSDNPPVLEVGTPIKLTLRFRNEFVEMAGEVKRHQGQSCAVMFTSAMDAALQSDDSRWHTIVVALQQLWLKSRLRKGSFEK